MAKEVSFWQHNLRFPSWCGESPHLLFVLITLFNFSNVHQLIINCYIARCRVLPYVKHPLQERGDFDVCQEIIHTDNITL